jgi:hypothetical protein
MRVNHKRVARIMRTWGIVGLHLRKKVRTTIPDRSATPVPDLHLLVSVRLCWAYLWPERSVVIMSAAAVVASWQAVSWELPGWSPRWLRYSTWRLWPGLCL